MSRNWLSKKPLPFVVAFAVSLFVSPLTWGQPVDSPRPTSRSALAITSASPGQFDVFARGRDNSLIRRRQQDDVWSPWSSHGGFLSSPPGVVSWAPGRLDVVARSQGDRLVQSWSGDPKAAVWSDFAAFPLAGHGDSAVTVCSWAPGRLDVFALGPDRALWHIFYQDRWSAWESLGGNLTSAPAAVSWSKDRIDVVARGAGQTMLHRFYNGRWSDWETLPFEPPPGTPGTDAPAICSWGPNHLTIFVRSASGAVWQQTYGPVAWAPWKSLGGNFASPPACFSPKKGRIELVGLDEFDRVIYANYEDYWSNLVTIGN